MNDKLAYDLINRVSEISEQYGKLKLHIASIDTDITNLKSAINDLYQKTNENTSRTMTLDTAVTTIIHNYSKLRDEVQSIDQDLNFKIKTLGNMNIQQNEEIADIKTLLTNVAAQLQQLADHFNQLTK